MRDSVNGGEFLDLGLAHHGASIEVKTDRQGTAAVVSVVAGGAGRFLDDGSAWRLWFFRVRQVGQKDHLAKPKLGRVVVRVVRVARLQESIVPGLTNGDQDVIRQEVFHEVLIVQFLPAKIPGGTMGPFKHGPTTPGPQVPNALIGLLIRPIVIAEWPPSFKRPKLVCLHWLVTPHLFTSNELITVRSTVDPPPHCSLNQIGEVAIGRQVLRSLQG